MTVFGVRGHDMSGVMPRRRLLGGVAVSAHYGSLSWILPASDGRACQCIMSLQVAAALWSGLGCVVASSIYLISI